MSIHRQGIANFGVRFYLLTEMASKKQSAEQSYCRRITVKAHTTSNL